MMTVNFRPQLITYADSLGGDLTALRRLLSDTPFEQAFGGVHILPPFPSSGDRGFAPTSYREIDGAFGSWADIRAIGERYDVALDLMVNHISRQSVEFQDFGRRGRSSPYADLFITLEKVWPGGDPVAEDVARIFLRRPRPPFSSVTIEETGATERVWTTFGRTEPSEQIDLDVRSPLTRQMLVDHLRFFSENGVRIVRLDAVGYCIKRAGTSCFMVEPETWEFLDWLTEEADGLGLTLLPEVHAEMAAHRSLSVRGYWTYDFALPLLTLHALTAGTADYLAPHLIASPRRQFTTLDTHDGIPVLPDLTGALPAREMARTVKHCLEYGANLSRLLSPTGEPTPGFDTHQINITYYSALAEDDAAYLAARAIQLFARGIPQIYYTGLLAGVNDPSGVAETGDGRAINRRNYTLAEIYAAQQRPVVRRVFELIRLRATHPAFGGDLEVEQRDAATLRLTWRKNDEEARLGVDLAARRAVVTWTDTDDKGARNVVARLS
jgi:sucrose 6(F)-phosphate phosphorylase